MKYGPVENNLNRKMDEYEQELWSLRLRRLALDPNRPCREKGVQTDPVGKKWLLKYLEKASTIARKNPAFDLDAFNAEYPEYEFDSDSGPEVKKHLPLKEITFTKQLHLLTFPNLPYLDNIFKTIHTLYFQDLGEVVTRRSKRIQESQSQAAQTETEKVALDEGEKTDEGAVQSDEDDDNPVAVEVIMEDCIDSVEELAARETTPEPQEEERFPTPKKMWRKRLSQESEDLPDTHLPGQSQESGPSEQSRYSPSRQPSLEASQDDQDGSQASLLSQLPDSQYSEEEDLYKVNKNIICKVQK